MSYFDDPYLFTDEIPASITLQNNRGRTFARRKNEMSWWLLPLELFIKFGDSVGSLFSASSDGQPVWDSITFQKDGTLLLKVQGSKKEKTLQPDDVLLVAGERGLNSAAASEGEVASLLGWKHVAFICKEGSHLLTLTPDACTRVYTLGLQVNPLVIGIDAQHRIFVPPDLKETESAAQHDALRAAAVRVLSARIGPAFGRSIFALFGVALFGGLTAAWILAGWRIRTLFFYLLPFACFGALMLFCSSVADRWDINKRLWLLDSGA